MLVVQDFTRENIASYVKEKLETDPRFIELQHEDPRCMDLVHDVTTKANGVFLWVMLVVTQLLKSLDNADGVHDLQRRLQQLPPGLEEYFQHMFDNIDEFYSHQTARMFQVSIWSEWPLSVVSYTVLEADDPVAARLLENSEVDEQGLERLTSRLTKRINGRCQDLLEVSPAASGGHLVVDFLHRTVRDFLLTREIHDLLGTRAGEDFDVLPVLCSMSLVEVRHLKFRSGDVLSQSQAQAVRRLMRYAREVERRHKTTPEHELVQLQIFLSKANMTSVVEHIAPFKITVSGTWKSLDGSKLFLALAVHEGLYIYIERSNLLAQLDLAHKSSQPSLLRLALEDFSTTADSHKTISPDLVRLLIRRGHNPNAGGLAKADKNHHHATPWSTFLANIGTDAKNCEGSMRTTLLLTTEVLISGGAAYEAAVLVKHNDYAISLSEEKVLSRVFGDLEATRLERASSTTTWTALA